MKNVLAMVMAGGAGERLYPLTRERAKPAVHFGAMYRIIDFTLSNCINSGCRRIQVLVQYKSHSLARHIRSAWDIVHRELGEFIDVVPPQMRVSDSWYLGTADAIYQNLFLLDDARASEVLILSGDHIYKMNYQRMVQEHREQEADLTIAVIPAPIHEGTQFGVLEVDESRRIVGFEEKPAVPKCMPGSPHMCLASMGIYVFNADTLRRVVREDAEDETSSHDFGKNIIPKLVDSHHVLAHVFQDENKKEALYWRDVGTIEAYWEANIDLVEVDPLFNLYDQEWPMRTNLPMLPPAKFVFATPGERFGVAVDSIVSPGCIISGGMVSRSVLSPAVRVNSYAYVDESVIFPGAQIGRYAQVRRAIIEKDVQIPEHAVIGHNLEEDAKHFRVTPKGVVVVESAEPLLAQV